MAARKKTKAVLKEKKHASPDVAEALRRPFLISVGALALAEEQFSTLIESLVKRGQKAEKAGQKYIKKLRKNGSSLLKVQEKKKPKKEEKESKEDWVLRALRRLNIPTRKDIETLDKKVDALIKKVA